jgi:acyl-CoA thioester hydrolase
MSDAAARAERPTRGRYPHFLSIATRWMDNDLYGHVNNVVYYAWIDTVVNRYLIEQGGLDIASAQVIGVAAESGCRYFASVAYPETVDAGLVIARLGRTSVVYEVGIFRRGEDAAAAAGHFVHVFVERASMRPAPVPARIRAALERILIPRSGV